MSPAALSASTEVRQYGLLLFFICGALYATERAFAERSTCWAIIQGLCLLGATLSHFTAPVVIACTGHAIATIDGETNAFLFDTGATLITASGESATCFVVASIFDRSREV